MSALRQRSPVPVAGLAAVGTGVLLGVLAVAPQVRAKTTTELAIGAVVIALLCVIVGDPRRVMLAAMVLDIPLEWGKNFFWRPDLANVGAIAGLNISLSTIAVAGLYAMWAFDRRRGTDTARRLLWRPALPLIVYVAVNAASVLAATDKTLASWELALLAQTLLLFIYIVSTIRTRQEVHFLVAVAMAGLLLESALILWIYVMGTDVSFLGLKNRVDPLLYNGRIGGTVGSPNSAAAYLCLMVPLAIGVLMSSASTGVRQLALIAAPMGVIALVITGSRGGWISFAISAVILGIWAIRKGFLKARVAVLAVLTVAALMVPFWGTITQRVSGNDNGSAASRITLIKLASHMIRAHPLLGVGINNVGINIPKYAGPEFDGQWLYTIHNKYLLVWAEAGIGALLAFLWFLLLTLRRGWRAATSGDRLLSPLAVGLAAGIAGQMVHMGVDLFQDRPQVEGLWLAAALLAAMDLIVRRGHLGRRAAR